MSTWKRTALGSGGAVSARNVLECVGTQSGYSWYYINPLNLITTKKSGNFFLYYESRPSVPQGQKRVAGFDPYLNVLYTGEPYISFNQNQERSSYGGPQMSDASLDNINDDIICTSANYSGQEKMVWIKNTGTPTGGYNYYEHSISTTYYNTNTAWSGVTDFRSHIIGDQCFTWRNGPNGCAYMRYRWPSSGQTTWYNSSDIQGINPGKQKTSALINTFDPIDPTSQSTEFIVVHGTAYSNVRFFRMTGAGALSTSGGFSMTQLGTNNAYYATTALDRANNTAYIYDSDQDVIIKWNYATNTVSTYTVTLPGGLNLTQISNPMVFLNGYLYLWLYCNHNSNGGIFLTRMDASNLSSTTAYKIFNTQGTRSLDGGAMNMVEGPNSATGETDLLSLAFSYRSAASGSYTDAIIANMLFTDIPQLASFGAVGAKLNVQSATVTVASSSYYDGQVSKFTNASSQGSFLLSDIYTGNQGTGYPGTQFWSNHWNSRSPYGFGTQTKTTL
jgi:hypothetical protein